MPEGSVAGGFGRNAPGIEQEGQLVQDFGLAGGAGQGILEVLHGGAGVGGGSVGEAFVEEGGGLVGVEAQGAVEVVEGGGVVAGGEVSFAHQQRQLGAGETVVGGLTGGGQGGGQLALVHDMLWPAMKWRLPSASSISRAAATSVRAARGLAGGQAQGGAAGQQGRIAGLAGNGPVELVGLHAGAALHGSQVHQGIGLLGGGGLAGRHGQHQPATGSQRKTIHYQKRKARGHHHCKARCYGWRRRVSARLRPESGGKPG